MAFPVSKCSAGSVTGIPKGSHSVSRRNIRRCRSPRPARTIPSRSRSQRVSGGADITGAPFDDRVRDLLLESIVSSGSDIVLLPVQDVFGWRDRINEPAKIDDVNWTFRLPWPIDRMDEVPEASERQRKLREWTDRYRPYQQTKNTKNNHEETKNDREGTKNHEALLIKESS
ncbi:MAG: hypothetical protein DMG00_17285 [Acidobacteria bacterium]|nr:MAG: hypothetical protein DMG00_17285 [Acidobacteriota bacterium]